MIINKLIKTLVFISQLIGFTAFAQLDYKISLESGLFKSKSDIFNSNKDFIARLTGDLSYKYIEKNRTARAVFKIQPGFVGADMSVDLLKYKAGGTYYQRYPKFGWGLNISTQKNLYYDVKTYYHKTTALEIMGNFELFKQTFVNLCAGYADQQVIFSSEQELERIYASVGMNFNLINKLNVSTGLYVEGYDLKSHSNLINRITYKNNGYRVGPKIYFSYLDKVSLRLSYSFIFQKSEVLDESAYEHQFRFIAGKIFKGWSIFAMIEFTDSVLDESETDAEETNLLRFPANYENNYYVKISKDLNTIWDVYLKLGYFNENIKYANFNFSGWNFLLGFEMAN